MERQWIATATFGLEAVVRREIEELGYQVQKTEDGKVTFVGHEEACCRSNLWLRCADRVLLKMGEFEVTTFEDLYQLVRGIAWEELIPLGGRIIVEGTSVKSTLSSVPACQSVAAKAIYSRLLDAYGLLPAEQEGADLEDSSGDSSEDDFQPAHWPEEEDAGLYKVRLTLKKDVATVAVDTTGAGLHKRGYRIQTVEAPIKETLAAAMIQLSFYKGNRVLVDFCTGSGTIPIEAALWACNIAPGLNRSFVSQQWPLIDKGLWQKARQEAYEAIDQEAKLTITAMDIDPAAVAAAKANAEEAGVLEDITFLTQDMADYEPAEANGIAVFNPPYGQRIGEEGELKHIYAALRDFMSRHPDWSLFFITADKSVEEALGREANRRRKLYNGRIETCYYQYHGDKATK